MIGEGEIELCSRESRVRKIECLRNGTERELGSRVRLRLMIRKRTRTTAESYIGRAEGRKDKHKSRNERARSGPRLPHKHAKWK